MTYEYCPLCGAKLEGRRLGDEGLVPWCAACERPYFSVVYPCVIIAVMSSAGEVLLIREVDKPRFACVAGYIKPGESAEQAVCREVLEEVGLEVGSVRYMGSFPLSGRDQLMLGFTCRAEDGALALSPGEVAEAQWLTPQAALDTMRQGSIAWQLVQAAVE